MNFFRTAVAVATLCVLLVSSTPIRHNPEEGDFFEGDIVGIPRDEKGAFQTPTLFRSLWPNGKITYIIDPAAAYSETELSNIYGGLKNIEDSTKVAGQKIIEFTEAAAGTPASELPDVYIKIIRGNGCYSTVGRQLLKGAQELSLGNNCANVGTTAHEFMHALGWFHEQSRTDRDTYVKIYPENIQKGYENNFDKYGSNVIGLLDMPYDYESVMHYPTTAFSSNGLPTIEPLTPGAVIGQRKGLSLQDALEIIRIYGPKKFEKN